MHIRSVLPVARGAVRRLAAPRAGQWMTAGQMKIRFMSMMVSKGPLKVDERLANLVRDEVCEHTNQRTQACPLLFLGVSLLLRVKWRKKGGSTPRACLFLSALSVSV